MEVRKDIISNIGQYCSAATKSKNVHTVELMGVENIKDINCFYHCSWLGLRFSGSDLPLLVLMSLIKLIAGVMTLIYYL